jgi:hypothetical protein
MLVAQNQYTPLNQIAGTAGGGALECYALLVNLKVSELKFPFGVAGISGMTR